MYSKVIETVKHALAERLAIDYTKLPQNSEKLDLRMSQGLDSLDLYEMVSDVEGAYGVTLHDEVISNVQTGEDLANAIVTALNDKKSAE